MSLNLGKESKPLNLTKSLPAITNFEIGLAWDEDPESNTKQDFDASIVILNNGIRTGLVYYGNLNEPGIHHSGDARDGDARDGDADGDDEVISIDLNEVEGDELIATITSYQSGTFGEAINPVARLYEAGSDKPLVESFLDADAAFGTAVQLVRFFLDGGEWHFENISESIGSADNGLTDVVARYAD